MNSNITLLFASNVFGNGSLGNIRITLLLCLLYTKRYKNAAKQRNEKNQEKLETKIIYLWRSATDNLI